MSPACNSRYSLILSTSLGSGPRGPDPGDATNSPQNPSPCQSPFSLVHVAWQQLLQKACNTYVITICILPVPAEDEHLRNVVDNGLRWYLLREDIPGEDAQFLSAWMNSDQDQNQLTSEAQHMKEIQCLVLVEEQRSPQVRVSTIVAKLNASSVLRLLPYSS